MDNIYQDIAQRTQGDIYIGVVGPVRTGKSTFIKRFMDQLVIPNMENEHKRARATDELPQSAQGRTIMTTEPKFVPNEAVELMLDNNTTMRVRLIDCVGYIVPDAMGYIEGDAPRMVSTPWFDHEIPFGDAAEIGTKKVITDHSTIGLVVTTDGSITELERDAYREAEERVIQELQAIKKPFVVLLNTVYPAAERTQALRRELEERYGVSVMPVNCAELSVGDINEIIERVLFEFPVSEINVYMPKWVSALEEEHWLKRQLMDCVKNAIAGVSNLRQTKRVSDGIGAAEFVAKVHVEGVDLGTGQVDFEVILQDGLFYRLLSEASGLEVDSEDCLMRLMIELAEMKREYERFAPALEQVRCCGYGIISPSIEELTLEEPEIVRQGSRYGVRLKASAPSIHMICNKPKPLEAA